MSTITMSHKAAKRFNLMYHDSPQGYGHINLNGVQAKPTEANNNAQVCEVLGIARIIGKGPTQSLLKLCKKYELKLVFDAPSVINDPSLVHELSQIIKDYSLEIITSPATIKDDAGVLVDKSLWEQQVPAQIIKDWPSSGLTRHLQFYTGVVTGCGALHTSEYVNSPQMAKLQANLLVDLILKLWRG